MIGSTFGLLTVVSKAEARSGRYIHWLCTCACGRVTSPRGVDLRRGNTKSCGCARSRNKKHGMSGTKLHAVWRSIRNRCENPRNRQYKDYGGRGIRLCEQWFDFVPFYEYVIGSYKQGLHLDRIDNDKGYMPGNVRWVSQAENNRNNRRNVRLVIAGVSVVQSEAAVLLGVQRATLRVWRAKGLTANDMVVRAATLTAQRAAQTRPR